MIVPPLPSSLDKLGIRGPRMRRSRLHATAENFPQCQTAIAARQNRAIRASLTGTGIATPYLATGNELIARQTTSRAMTTLFFREGLQDRALTPRDLGAMPPGHEVRLSSDRDDALLPRATAVPRYNAPRSARHVTKDGEPDDRRFTMPSHDPGTAAGDGTARPCSDLGFSEGLAPVVGGLVGPAGRSPPADHPFSGIIPLAYVPPTGVSST